MIKVQYVADHKEWENPPEKCDACGKSITDDNSAVMVTFEYDSVWNDIVLCSSCRRELYEKI